MAHPLEVDSPFQADARSFLGIIVAVLIGAVATAAGVGGGAIYIPLFNVLVGFALKPSTALSQACIAAGSLAAVATNLPRTHPGVAAAPLIDFPLVLLLTPLLLVGVGIGVLLNVTLPSWLLNILLLVLLLLLLAQAIGKGRALWAQETKRAQAAAEAIAHRDIENSAESPDHAASGSGMLEALLPAGHRRSFSHPALVAVASIEPPGLDLRRGHSYSGPGAPVALETDQDASSGRLEGFENSGVVASHQPTVGISGGIAGGSTAIRPARRFPTMSWDCTENATTTGEGTARCETPYSSVSMPPSAHPFAGPRAPSFVIADDASAEGPTRSIHGGAASSRALSTVSSAIYAPSWKAFNELGALEFETDLEGDSDFEGVAPAGSAIGRHMRSNRTSGFGSGTASPVLFPPSSYILSQLPRRLLPAQMQLSSAARSPHTAVGRRTTRRRSFDQTMGADLAEAVAMDEETGLGGNSWLQRRSKWRSRFPPGALPLRGASRAALLPAKAYPGSSAVLPPVQQLPPSPGTALRASGSGVMRLQSRSQRQGDCSVGDAEGGRGGLDEPLLGVQGEVVDRPLGTSPDPRAEYGGGAAAPGLATAAGGDPGGGRVLAADSYRPPTRLATLHEEADDRMEGGTSGGGSGSQSTQVASDLPKQLPSMAASTSAASFDQSTALPTSQPAADWDPLQRPSLRPVQATSASLYDRHDGNHATGRDVTADAMALKWTSMDAIGYVYIECMSDTEAEKRHLGGWCCYANFIICGVIAATARQWADEWAAALSRIPHRFACGLIGAWVVYLVLQGARDFKTQCSPAWWALFAIQTVAMLAISGGAMAMTANVLPKHKNAAESSNGDVSVENREATPVITEDRSGSVRRRQQQHGHAEEKEGSRGEEVLSTAVTVEPALQCSAALLVLQAPLTTLCATFGAGLTGGLLGLGGGMVMGPLLLQIGVHPQVTAASSGAMVLFSSSAALIQFALLHRLNAPYAGIFAAASLVAGVAGTHAVARAIKRSGRPSIVVLALAGVMGIGTVCVAAFGLRQAANQLRNGDLGFEGICSSCGGK